MRRILFYCIDHARRYFSWVRSWNFSGSLKGMYRYFCC